MLIKIQRMERKPNLTEGNDKRALRRKHELSKAKKIDIGKKLPSLRSVKNK